MPRRATHYKGRWTETWLRPAHLRRSVPHHPRISTVKLPNLQVIHRAQGKKEYNCWRTIPWIRTPQSIKPGRKPEKLHKIWSQISRVKCDLPTLNRPRKLRSNIVFVRIWREERWQHTCESCEFRMATLRSLGPRTQNNIFHLTVAGPTADRASGNFVNCDYALTCL